MIIKRIDNKKEINTDIPKRKGEGYSISALKMQKLHQVDDVGIGSPLGPVLANTFTVKLGQNAIPALSDDT